MSPASEGKLYSATPRAFRTYCLFIPRLLMSWQPRIQNLCSHGINLVPLEFRSKHHKASMLKVKSWLTPKTCDMLGFFADKVLYMGAFVVLLAVAPVLNVSTNRCRWYRLTMPYEGMYCIAEGTVTQKLLPPQCQVLVFHRGNMQTVLIALSTRIATDNPRCIVAPLQVIKNDVVSHFTVGADHCFGGVGETEYSTVHGWQCERLRVDEGSAAMEENHRCQSLWWWYSCFRLDTSQQWHSGKLLKELIYKKLDCCIVSNWN